MKHFVVRFWKQRAGILVLALMVFSSVSGMAQIKLLAPSGAVNRNYAYVTNYDRNNLPLETKIEGSPFLYDSLKQGKLFSVKGEVAVLKMRYNICYDRLEFMEKDTVYSINPDPMIDNVQLGDTTLVVRQFEHHGKMVNGFFLLLDAGKLTILAQLQVEYRDRVPERPMTDPIPAHYERKSNIYYFQIEDGPLTRFGSMKKLIENLPDRRKEMTEFAKREEISARDGNELAKFARYYNAMK